MPGTTDAPPVYFEYNREKQHQIYEDSDRKRIWNILLKEDDSDEEKKRCVELVTKRQIEEERLMSIQE